MDKDMKESSSDSKTVRGWILVRDVLGDEEKYLALKQGFPITLKGNLGTDFILYPNGHFVKLGKDKPSTAKMDVSGKFVKPDYLATIIAYIIHNQKYIETKWGCGHFRLKDFMSPEEREERRRRYEERRLQRLEEEKNKKWYQKINWSGSGLPLFITFLIVVVVVMPIVSIILLTNFVPPSSTESTNETSTNSTNIFKEVFGSGSIMPLILVACFFLMMIAMYKTFDIGRW